MSWVNFHFLELGVVLIIGALLGAWITRRRQRHLQAAFDLKERTILENARRESENLAREAHLAATEEVHKLRDQTEKSFASRRRELAKQEERLSERENLINVQLARLVQQEKQVFENCQELSNSRTALEQERDELKRLAALHKEQIQKNAHLTEAEARVLLFKQVEQETLRDAADLSRHILDNAKARAEEQARQIISLAIQRYAGRHTFETTTATVALGGDEMKGRIIGRDGRNIRAFEAATGVTVLIDDTPNAVVLSAFDPVRREIAREAMERLIHDGRIHPTRIEEVVQVVSREIDETILKAGEEAIYRAGLPPLHREITKVLGSLRFRMSFSQNILDHSVEVAQLMGLMAAELGLDIAAAKRAGLLHDIGKGLNHEVEGAHAIVGANFIERFGESEEIVNGVASHHDEVPHTNPFGILVSAADAISASRPGARSESMTTYIKRLENLEKIGLSFAGVEKCFAIQAGRELRIMVRPDELGDEQATLLARNVARKIEEELQYPGQIRVTVVRETRCVEFAK